MLVCACGLGFLGVGVFGLFANVLTALLIVSAVVGLVLVCCGVFASDKTCGDVAEDISQDGG